MKILFVTTIGSTFAFFTSIIEELIARGYTVDVACNDSAGRLPERIHELGCRVHSISCSRSPFDINNLKAIKEIRDIADSNNYSIVHCHTPIASVCARLACKKNRRKGLKIFYTAHGFHFYKGAPLKNWMLYYPIEKYCARLTDVLITINKEDYAFAEKHLPAKSVVYTHGGGGGTGLRSFKPVSLQADEKRKIREALGLDDNDIALICAGELIERKNQKSLIKAMSLLSDRRIHLFICGDGPDRQKCDELIKKLRLKENVHLLGFRTDTDRLLAASDIFMLPSFQEGLSASLLEAMASRLPVICSDIRGNVDLIADGAGGYLHSPSDINAIAAAITSLSGDKTKRQAFGERNAGFVKGFNADVLIPEIMEIYRNEMQRRF